MLILILWLALIGVFWYSTNECLKTCALPDIWPEELERLRKERVG